MTDLLAARSQMAMSLAFHIIFAAIGIAMPVLMIIAERRWLRTRKESYLVLAQRWAKGTAILFAVGAVSGTVLSFELGLLWPAFMRLAGPVIGLLFALEGFAFFGEAIFLGIYIHGWHRVPPYAHFWVGIVVAVSGVASAVFVVMANAWMNRPIGFELSGGRPVNVDPLAVMLNPLGLVESLHMVLAAFAATGFAVAGMHAFLLLRDRRNLFHQRALSIALVVGGLPAILQPLSGDILARAVADYQPIKLAAFEGQFQTRRGASLSLGGIADANTGSLKYAIEIPYMLSWLLRFDPTAVVHGLEEFPRRDWPPVSVVHIAFQVMVGSGLLMMATALWGAWRRWRRKRLISSQAFLWALVLTGPLGFLAIEAGWVVTEVGRQPWIVFGVMRTAQAVTPMPGLIVPLVTFTGLYILLAVIVVWLLRRQILASPEIVRDRPDGRRIKNSHAIS